MRFSKTAVFFVLMVLAFAPAAFARPAVPDATGFSLMGATGLFLLGAIKRKFGR